MVDLHSLYDRMEENNIMLSFKGEVTFDLIDSLLKVIEHRLDAIESDKLTKKKVYNVLVECMQNLCHHIDHIDDSEGGVHPGKTAILIIFSDEGTYNILTGNYLPKAQVGKLKDWLEQINSKDKESLRELYKRILNEEEESGFDGVGLGFVDIARKSGQKLKYNFKPINENYWFFSFQINITK